MRLRQKQIGRGTQDTKLKTQNAGCKTLLVDPIAEIVITLDSRGRRNWHKLNDDALVAYAQRFIDSRGLARNVDLDRADSGLHGTLQQRVLMGRVKFKHKTRIWRGVGNSHILAIAKQFVEKKGVSSVLELQKLDNGLCIILRRRGLMKEIPFKRRKSDWSSMGDEELLKYARKAIEENGISCRYEMDKRFRGLYQRIKERGLADRLDLDKRRWRRYNDMELVDYSKRFMREAGVESRSGLRQKDNGLYSTLWARGLLNWIFAEIEQAKNESLESELISGLSQAAEAMEKFGREEK